MSLAISLATTLAGCASNSPGGGIDAVDRLTRERVGHGVMSPRSADGVERVRLRVAELLEQPLTADGAVEVALLNNRGLQVSLAEIGLAESDLLRAGTLRNPSISFTRLAGAGIVEIERSIIVNVMSLLTMPAARRAEQSRFEAAQYRAAYRAVDMAAQARRAYYSAVAAQQLADYALQIQEAADAASELARRMQQAGNFSKLAQMREQAFHADAYAELARSRHRLVFQREQLARVMGLSGDQMQFKLPDRLPDLPLQVVASNPAAQAAIDNRLDVLASKRSVASVASSLGLVTATRLVDVLHAGYVSKSHTGEARADGYDLELMLPMFDFGTARVARAQSIYMQAMHSAADVALHAASEVRESHSAYRTAHELARHYRDEVVPLRKRISDENLLRYNGMLIGVFELLADTREQIAGVTAYIEALRDFWIAEADLQLALTGGSPADRRADRMSLRTNTRAVESDATH